MATPSSPLSPRPTHKLRKISSAHDLYKANKHQRDCINTTVEKIPMPKMDLARSRSLNAPKKARLPLVPSEMPFSSSVSARQRPMQSSHIRVASASDTSRRFASNPNDEDDDDDDVPLAATAGIMPLSAISSMHQKQPICRPSSLLNDHDEEDDKDLVPIAVLAQTEIKADQEEYLSAADKYKEKVKERLNLDDGNEDEDDDDIPISVAHMRSLRNQPQHKTRPDVMDMWMSPATQTV
ncbi:hypothetical protein DFQ30_009701 [Apophysomyces sp. BC1015]|nr:hypothetical protein DFQ30_009701 [Apophysomyces sp. BC1015]